MNGFAVNQRFKQVSGDVLHVSGGSLYPALRQLQEEGCITAQRKTSEYGRRVKYHSLSRLAGDTSKEKQMTGAGFISRVTKLKEA